MKKTAIIFIITIAFPILLFACKSDSSNSTLTLPKTQIFESYGFDKKSDLITRVTTIPDFVLHHMQEFDKRPDYKGYNLSKKEMTRIGEAFNKLPDYLKNNLKNRLIGIYFIKDFMGSGFAEWVKSSDDEFYFIMIFNSKILDMSISKILTWRENTAFKGQGSDPGLKIHCPGPHSENGFLYILLHESAHCYDYIHKVTPWVDEGVKKFQKNITNPTVFTRGIWKDYKDPVSKKSFHGKLAFYGFGEQKLYLKILNSIYKELSESPFSSLYGTSSWAEDFAELATYYHLTKKLNHRYFIEVIEKGEKTIYEPMKFDGVKKRLAVIEKLYQ